MAETTRVSIRVSVKTATRLKSLAAALKRSKSTLGAEALEEYLTLREWQIKAIKQGIKDADAGRMVEHNAVAEWIDSWGSADEKGLPQCN